MRIETYDQAEVPEALRAQVVAIEDDEWPPVGGRPGPGHDPLLDPVTVLLLDGATVVSSLAILSKAIHHGGATFHASGLSAVVTAPAYRGRGHGHRLVSHARAVIEAGGADLVIFTCDPPLVPFYVHAGYAVLPGTALVGGTVEAPLRSDVLGKVTLAAFLTASARAMAAAFEGTDVELYPGPVDRLW